MKPLIKKARNTKTAWMAIAILLFFAILNIPVIKTAVQNSFYSFSSPAQRFFWIRGNNLSNYFVSIINARKIKDENEWLKAKVNDLLLKTSKIADLENENEILRKAMSLGLDKDFIMIMGDVVSKDIGQDSMIINRGAKDGVSQGMVVITEEKLLIGKIIDVYQDSSRMALISNKEMIFNARLYRDENDSREDIQGVVYGSGNLSLELKLIPKEKDIKEGDNLITVTAGGVFPEGLLVGKIISIQSIDIEPFWKVKVQPAFDLGRLNKIFIIKDY